jgi:hypothetical protein
VLERSAVGGQAGSSSKIENYLGFRTVSPGRHTRKATGHGTSRASSQLPDGRALQPGTIWENDTGRRGSFNPDTPALFRASSSLWSSTPLVRDIAAMKEIADHIAQRRSGFPRNPNGIAVVFLRCGRHR